MPKTAPKPKLAAVTALNPWCWALAAVQESITMYRRPAQEWPLPFTEEIRAAKDTLASLLAKLGRKEEAAAIRHEITQSDPLSAG